MNTNKTLIKEPYLTNSRLLRKNQTPWEAKFWHYLRAQRFYGLKFKRQVQIGKYIYDFSCREKMLLVEADGGQHNESKISQYDELKQNFAEKIGYKVLRFWNNEIDQNIEGVLSKIKEVCGV
jgi:very-short-patch-repair endonuclease